MLFLGDGCQVPAASPRLRERGVAACGGCRSRYSIVTFALVLALGGAVASAAEADQTDTSAPVDRQEQNADAKEPPTPTHTGHSCAGGQSRRGHQALARDAECLSCGNRRRAGARGPSSRRLVERSFAKPVGRRRRLVGARKISRRHARADRHGDWHVRIWPLA